jgi:hypothetical protein
VEVAGGGECFYFRLPMISHVSGVFEGFQDGFRSMTLADSNRCSKAAFARSTDS